jgi:molecular chaperone DnaK (HSP70)
LLEFVVYGIFIVILILSFASNVISFLKNKRLEANATKLALEKFTISKELQKVLAEKESSKLEQSDGFLRFISQSRDWAFKYIEDVQKAIQDFETAIESKNDQKIEDALNNLKSFLPDNEEENNKINKEKNEN